MKTFTRVFSVLCCAAAVAGFGTSALAQSAASYPDKPIRFIVPYPPGGASDVTARVLGQKMTEIWGQPVVVENRPGANGNIASEFVARAPADGYTILMGNVGPNAISASMYKLSYDVVKSFAPVTQTTTVPIVLVVNNSLPVKNVKELISYAKTNKLTFASAGNGSSNHLTGELLKSMAGIDIMHVPYKGDGPAMNDVIGGQVSMMFATLPAALPHIKSGKVRPIGMATAKPSAVLPGVTPIAESGVPGFDSSSWGGILAPAGTPKEIIAKLHEGTVKILKMPDVEQKMQALGSDIIASTPEQFGEYIKSETSKWAKVVKESGATVN